MKTTENNTQTVYPPLLRIGTSFLGVGALIATKVIDLSKHGFADMLTVTLLMVGLLLSAIGGVQFVLRNERLKINTFESRLGNAYFFLFASVIGLLLIATIVSYFIQV